jgi:uncharacterized protein
MPDQNSSLRTKYTGGGMKKINVFDSALSHWKVEVKPLRFSTFAHQFRQDGTVALYHSLTHQVVYLDSNAYEELREKIKEKGELTEGDRDIIEELIKQGFLVSLSYDEHRIIREIRSRFLGKPVFGILYLLLTDVCNLRCRYCFIEGAMPTDHVFSWMSEETAIKGINLFTQLLERNPEDRKIERPTIIFYGGEPLLNRKAFLASLNEITRLRNIGQLPSDLSISLIANATVLGEDILKGIVENEVAVSVSLDGPKDLHDANRVFANKRGTFQTVLRNIQRLQAAGVNLSVSCTINPQNLDQLEEVFQWMITEFQLRGLGFNMLLDLPGVVQADKAYAKKATEKIIGCYQIARERGIYEDRIMRKVKAFVKKYLHVVDCGGYGNQIVITPDARIGPCHAYTSSARFFPANLNDPNFDPFQDSVFIEWSSRSPFNIPKCYFCEAIGLCGGGCAYNADLKFGSIWKVDSNFCIHSKMVLEWLIWDLYQKTMERR